MSLRLAEALGSRLSPAMITGPYQPVVDRIENEYIRKIRVNLKKDRQLSESKQTLIRLISDMEKSCRYTGHITINVDPS